MGTARKDVRNRVNLQVWRVAFCSAFILGLTILGMTQVTAGYEIIPDFTGTILNGRVVYRGPLPREQPIAADEHEDRSICGAPMQSEALIVDKESHGVASSVISLEGVGKGKPFPENRTLHLGNRECKFIPRMSAISIDSRLELSNADPILHNSHIRKYDSAGPTIMNVVQPAGSKIQKSLHEVGFLDVRCRKHTFMRAGIHMFDHPYFAVTDKTGRFELTHVPPGTYTLRAWHEILGSITKTITVTSKGPVTLDIELSSAER